MTDQRNYQDTRQGQEILESNLVVAKTISSIIKTSLGPKGLDKMFVENGKTTITNDGATIMNRLRPTHPIAHLLQELANSQDTNAGDGTTSCVLLAGGICESIEKLLNHKVHPAIIRKSITQLMEVVLDFVKLEGKITTEIDLNPILDLLDSNDTKNRKSTPPLKEEESKVLNQTLFSLARVIANILSSKNISNYPKTFIPSLLLGFIYRLPKDLGLSFASGVSFSKIDIYSYLGFSIENSSFMPGSIFVKARFPDRTTTQPFRPEQSVQTGKDKTTLSYNSQLDLSARPNLKPFIEQISAAKPPSAFACLFLQTSIFSRSVNPKPTIDSSITIRSHEQIDSMIAEKQANFRALVRAINKLHSELGVNAFFYQKLITQSAKDDASVFDEKFVSFLERKGIFLGELTREEFEKCCKRMKARPVVKLDTFMFSKSESTDKKELQKMKEFVVHLEGVKRLGRDCLVLTKNSSFKEREAFGTFFLTSSNEVLLGESKRSVEDALGVLNLLLKKRDDTRTVMVKGGGVFELECSRILRWLSRKFQEMQLAKLEAKEEVPFFDEESLTSPEIKRKIQNLTERNLGELSSIAKELSTAFDQIVVKLAGNAGLDAVEVLGRLKNLHESNVPLSGLDVEKGVIDENISIETPFAVNESMVKLASEFCLQVLKINDVLN